ncbi:MAG: hypothetical protein PVF08_05810 [Gammaproteobacteria bacterium]|jgi:hypothetical protein
MTSVQAWDFGDMMDPGEWFGGNDDDWYDRGYYGGYGPYGWGGGPYGWGGGPYGWGGGPYGWGGGPYGWGGYGGYGGYPGAIVVNPNQGSSAPPPKMPE